MIAKGGAGDSDPKVDNDVPPRRPGDSITDFGAVIFLLVLFLLALGLMHLIGPQHA